MAVRLALINDKGGVGKSHAAARLMEALAKAGRRVGGVDFDPQGNLSRRLGWTHDGASPTVSEAIASGTSGVMREVRRPVGWDTPYAHLMTICPSRMALKNRATEAGELGAVRRLRVAMEGVDDDDDVTIIDCPPGLYHLSQMALSAADGAIIVTEPEYDSVKGATEARDFVKLHPENLGNPKLTLVGVIVNGMQNNGDHKHFLGNIRDLFGDLVLDPVIKHRAALLTADANAVPLAEVTGPRGREARAVWELMGASVAKAVGL